MGGSVKDKRKCRTDECETLTASSTGLCEYHVRVYAPCRHEGCTNTVSAWSRYGHCRDHYWLGQKLGRAMRDE